MNPQDFLESIKATFISYFPNGHFAHSGLNEGQSFTFQIGLISEKNAVPFCIRDNDPMHHLFYAWPVDDRYEVTVIKGGRILVKPPEWSHLAFFHVKTKWRKKTADLAKQEKALKNWLAKLAKLFVENKGNIAADNLPEKYLLVNLKK